MTDNESQGIKGTLEYALENCTTSHPFSQTDWKHIDDVMVYFESGKNTAVVHVLVTLMVKKLLSPGQDIRLHKQTMAGGFRGRRLDGNHITPFLLEHELTSRPSSGWQTHSLQKNQPYDQNYPGLISPPKLKTAFLHLVNRLQTEKDVAQRMLSVFLAKLVELRENRKSSDS